VALVRKLQPNAVVFGATQTDVVWSGNEEGTADYPQWYIIPSGEGPKHYLASSVAGYLVPEANVHTRPTWFWTPNSDDKLRPLSEMLNIYYSSIGRGANLLINLTPDTRGLIPDAEVKRAAELGAELNRRFAKPLATTDSTDRWSEANTLDLDLGRGQSVDHILLEEDLRFGQRIRSYKLEAFTAGKWTTIVSGQSIGRKRIERFAPVNASVIRLRVLETDPLPKLRTLAAYFAGAEKHD
jgi:alpha-L-fucosidase